MTGQVYVLQLASGRAVKLEVLSYYSPAVQDVCDATDMLPMGQPSGSAHLRVKWAYLP